MWAQLKSTADERDYGPDEGADSSRGHSLTIESNNLTIHSRGDDLQVRAKGSVHSGGAKRRGREKIINKQLVMNLTKKDIQAILEKAIEQKLISLPGSGNIAQAIKLLVIV